MSSKLFCLNFDLTYLLFQSMDTLHCNLSRYRFLIKSNANCTKLLQKKMWQSLLFIDRLPISGWSLILPSTFFSVGSDDVCRRRIRLTLIRILIVFFESRLNLKLLWRTIVGIEWKECCKKFATNYRQFCILVTSEFEIRSFFLQLTLENVYTSFIN